MSEAPLFDETGQHCLRPVQGQEEGVLFIQKLVAGTLKSCSLGDLLKIVDKLEIPLQTVIDLLGEAKVSFDDET
ncbi:hypothetical protein N9L26_02725 [Candidatus Pacebacteria bacterium]|nr:hypothetical protein [Candidatus Paceibacterota bacterium]